MNSKVVVVPGQPLGSNVIISNTGKTVAKGIYIDTCVEMLDIAVPAQRDRLSSCYSRPHFRMEGGMLFPGTSSESQKALAYDQRKLPVQLNSTQSVQFTTGNAYVITYGRVHYIDAYGKSRWTQFCIPTTSSGDVNPAARQCVNFSDEGEGDYKTNYAEAE